MKKITLLVSFIACFVCAQAQLLLNENFDYTVGSDLVTNGWTIHSGTTFPILVTAPTITYNGYPSSGIGAEVSVGVTGIDMNRTFTTQTTGTVYTSFIVNIVSASTTGDYFFHVGPNVIGTSFFGRTFVKSDSNNKLAFGIQNASGGTVASQTYTPFSYDLNTTYLIVLKVVVTTGESSIIVNPLIDAEPTTGWISNNTGTTLPVNIGSVALRQGSAPSSPTFKLDGIRVATSYQSLFSNSSTGIFIPNAENILNISLTGKILTVNNIANGSTVEIYSTTGVKVQSLKLENSSVQLNNLSKGLYIVRVANQSSKIML